MIIYMLYTVAMDNLEKVKRQLIYYNMNKNKIHYYNCDYGDKHLVQ